VGRGGAEGGEDVEGAGRHVEEKQLLMNSDAILSLQQFSFQ
jgi:hypothetical protein